MQITGGFGVGECSMEPRKRKWSKHFWGARFSCAASRVVGYGHLSEEEAGACGEASMGAGCGRRGTRGNWLLFMESLCCWLMYVKLVNSCKWNFLNSPFSACNILKWSHEHTGFDHHNLALPNTILISFWSISGNSIWLSYVPARKRT